MSGTVNLELISLKSEELHQRLQHLASQPGCRHVSGLVDCAMSNHETPYSAVAAFRDYVIPQVISRNISCGMAVMRLDASRDELRANADQVILRLHESLRTSFYTSGYPLLNAIYQRGPKAILEVIPDLEGRADERLMEGHDLAPFLERPRPLGEVLQGYIPSAQRLLRIPDQRFLKNHFVEFGYITPLTEDQRYLEEGTVASFHFESALSNAVTRSFHGSRLKERNFALLKGVRGRASFLLRILRNAIFHGKHEAVRDYPAVVSYLQGRNLYVPIPVDSLFGQRFLSAVVFQMNYERACRLAMASRIAECVEAVLGRPVEWSLLFESGHHTYDSESVCGEQVLMARGDCVKADRCAYGFLSGMYDVPSMLLVPNGRPPDTRWLNTYDHGIGNSLWRDKVDPASLKEELGVDLDRLFSGKDVSQFERLHNSAPAADSGIVTESEMLDQVVVYRPAGKAGAALADRRVLPVRQGNAFRHVLEAYRTGGAPVDIIGKIVPVINYKVRL